MRYCFSIILFFVFFVASANNNPATLLIRINNLKSDTIFIAITPLSDPENKLVDTLTAKNGLIEHNFEVNELTEVMIIPAELFHQFKDGISYPLPGSRIKVFFNKGDRVDITGKIEGTNIVYSVKGNKISEQLANSRQDKLEVFNSRFLFESVYHEKPELQRTPEEEKKYLANRGANNLAYQNSHLAYVNNHLNDEVSPLLLLEISNKDTVAILYQQLGLEAKSSYFGDKLSKYVRAWYAVKPGQKMPALNVSTIDGKQFSLGSYKGKYVLLDFWGSWCVPCITEMPSLKSFYSKNAEKVELVGMICKDMEKKALAAISKYALKWPQLYSGNDEYRLMFGITSYPTKILLDPNGVVLKIYEGINDTMMNEIDAIVNK